MPDPRKVLTTIRRATELLRRRPGDRAESSRSKRRAEVMVVGDLHGNISAFKKVLAIAALDRHPGRHLVLQELIHGPSIYPTTGAIARISFSTCSRPSSASIPTGSTSSWATTSSRS